MNLDLWHLRITALHDLFVSKLHIETSHTGLNVAIRVTGHAVTIIHYYTDIM